MAALSIPSSADQRRPGGDDHLALESVGAPAISPDGKWVAYSVESIDAEEGESESAIWLVARAGGDPLRMTGRGDDFRMGIWRS